MSYPTNPPAVPRSVSLKDAHFRVVEAYHSSTPVVVQTVNESRIGGDWVDFVKPQTNNPRGMQSAFQVPIYRTIPINNGKFIQKEPLGVLSIDADKPDFFLQVEVDAWIEDFTGYLANLALAEHMRRAELRRQAVIP